MRTNSNNITNQLSTLSRTADTAISHAHATTRGPLQLRRCRRLHEVEVRAPEGAVADRHNAVEVVLHEGYRKAEACSLEAVAHMVALLQELQLARYQVGTMECEERVVDHQRQQSMAHAQFNRSNIGPLSLEKRRRRAIGHSDMTRYASCTPIRD